MILMRMLSALMIGCVRIYQILLSPLIGDCCRFTPTCSKYCIEAIRIHGPFVGFWLTLKRLLKCRPYGPSGYDPVPTEPIRWWRKKKGEKEK